MGASYQIRDQDQAYFLTFLPLAQASRLCLQSTTSETKKPLTSVESSVKVRLSRRKFHVDQGKWYEHSSTTWIISSASSANDTEEGQFLISCSVVLLFNPRWRKRPACVFNQLLAWASRWDLIGKGTSETLAPGVHFKGGIDKLMYILDLKMETILPKYQLISYR